MGAKLLHLLRAVAVTAVMMAAATGVCWVIIRLDGANSNIISIYVLAVQIVSLLTPGYLFGVLASVAGVMLMNYCFTYPYLALNFTLDGYPLTFFTMLLVSVVTSALMMQMRRHAERAFRQARQAEREKMRSNLLRAVSHDLRTPLTAISGAAQTLLEEGEHLSPDTQRRLLGNVAEDSRWLIRMVENLLSITRIGGEGGRLQKTEELAEEVAAGAAEQVSKRHPECRIAVQGGEEPLFAPMEPTLIEQVLINLMENAIQHGGAGGLVEVRFRQLGASLEFQVRDHGPGLAPEDIPGLFQGGAQTSSDATRGMGIGLSLCQTIIAAHGGVISGENHPGGGALFTFSIPLDGEAAGGEKAWNQTTS